LHAWRASMTDFGEVTLWQGDCLERMRDIPEGTVDAIVTSPPYNQLGKRQPAKGSGIMQGNRWLSKVAAKGYVDDMQEADYLAWLASVADALARVARPGASFFFNHKVRWREGAMLHPIDYVRAWPGWTLKQEIIWDQAGAIAFNCGLFAPTDERIYWLVKPGAAPTWNPGAAGMLSVWRVDRNRHIKGSIVGHPCPYPVEIPKRCIEATTKPGDTVLDPFAGSGTTLVACMKTGRKCIGIELDPKYIPIIERRVKSAETPLFQGLDVDS
jgi:site-specific DNA-methyltransferase (adenine-specific)